MHIYLSKYSSNSRLRTIVFSIILFLAASFLSTYLVVVLYNGIIGNVIILQEYKITIIIALLILNYLLYNQIKKIVISNSVKLFSRISVMLGLYGYICLIQPIKLFWGRIRFRDLESFYTNFTPWFLPNGINGNQSFPSGHAAMAWILLPLLLLVVNKGRKVKIPLLILITCWGIVVSLSRVAVGAHYASDVLFGSSILIIVFIVITYSYWDTSKKY